MAAVPATIYYPVMALSVIRARLYKDDIWSFLNR